MDVWYDHRGRRFVRHDPKKVRCTKCKWRGVRRIYAAVHLCPHCFGRVELVTGRKAP
jgi:ribosomal protein L37AE/L43A